MSQAAAALAQQTATHQLPQQQLTGTEVGDIIGQRLPGLRQQVAAKIARSYGVQRDADSEITITPGATEAIFCAVQALIHPGDEAIVLDPCYDSYEPSVELAGGRCVHVQLNLENFSLDFEKIQAALSARTRMIILNTPHNPTGALISRAELDLLARRGIQTLTIEKADTFLESLVLAVRLEKQKA